MQLDRKTDRETYKQINRQADIVSDRQTRQTDRGRNRETSKHTRQAGRVR